MRKSHNHIQKFKVKRKNDHNNEEEDVHKVKEKTKEKCLRLFNEEKMKKQYRGRD